MAGTLPSGYSKEDALLLTDEERKGMLELGDEENAILGLGDTNDEPDDGGAAPAAEGAQTTDDEPDGGESGDKDKEEHEDKSEGEGEGSKKTADDVPEPDATKTGQQPEPKAEPDKPAKSSLPRFEKPADYEKNLTDLRAQRRDLRQKFEDGELTAAEYDEQDNLLDDKIHELRTQNDRADLSIETRKNDFANAAQSFLDEHTEYGSHPGRYRELDAAVRQLQVEAQTNGGDPLDASILAKAHAMVERDWGVAAEAKTRQQSTSTTRRPPPPPTLAHVPAAEPEDLEDNGAFAALDRLTGEAYEDALAKLSPDQRDAYLAQ